jgi:hypothetical protein
MKDFGNAKSVPGELIGITTAAEGPRIEVEALDIAWDIKPSRGDLPPMIPIYDLRSSGAVVNLREFVEKTRRDELRSLLGLKEFKVAAEQYWKSVGAADRGRSCGIKMDLPGQDLLTGNPTSGRLIGIHLDNWHGSPARLRYLSPQRLALNLGPGARWLLLIDTREFWREICAGGDGEKIVGTPRLRSSRFARGEPVYRYRVDPGFAYLASTEFYGHDGSTRWTEEPSITAQWWNVIT